jgi:hypothetical protein
MGTQTVNIVEKMWCGCVGHSIEHQRVSLQRFGGTFVQVYQCSGCKALKRVKFKGEIDNGKLRLMHRARATLVPQRLNR